MLRAAEASKAPALGITGTGGAGKSSLTDELIRRFRLDQDDRLKIAVISIDPSRRKSGGALLGDRIRMNAIQHPNIYMRSMATREAGSEVSQALPDAIAACKVAGFDLIVVETSGIGQGDAAIVPLVDVSLYVMTPEFGAASQLEKIDMLDFADFVAINKFDRRGAADALRDVRKQYQRNRELFKQAPDQMPVYGTIAARFNDDGVTALYQALAARLSQEGLKLAAAKLPAVTARHSTGQNVIVPPQRVRYLAEIADTVRGYHGWAKAQAKIARERQQLRATKAMLTSECKTIRARRRRKRGPATEAAAHGAARNDEASAPSTALLADRDAALDPRAQKLLAMWPQTKAAYTGDEYVVKIRGKEIRTRADDRFRSPARMCRRSRCRSSRTTPRSCAGSCARTSRAAFRSPPACSRSSARTRIRPGCSPARATRSAPTSASTCSPTACRRSACPPRSTRSRCTATIPICGPTSTARSAIPACRSRRSTT